MKRRRIFPSGEFLQAKEGEKREQQPHLQDLRREERRGERIFAPKE